MQASDINNALPMKNDTAAIARPPINGPIAFCRQP